MVIAIPMQLSCRMSTSVPSYKLKRIQYFKREVPIALQNENGPCPLLAIANVLLLRNQIKLPANAPDVSQVGSLPQPCLLTGATSSASFGS